MDPEIAALATTGATTLVQAMSKDLWSSLRDKLASLFGSDSAQIANELEVSRNNVLQQQHLGPVVEDEWRSRLQRHLYMHPEAVEELRVILEEVAPGSVQNLLENRIEGGVSGTAVQTQTVHGGVHSTSYHQHGGDSPRINAQTEAALVHVLPSYNGESIELNITNYGSRPVRNAELVHIARTNPAPGESWKLNPNVWNVRARWDVLNPGQKQRTFVWLLNAHGRHIADLDEIRAVSYRVRFVDYEGQWWERTENDSTHKVSPPT